MKFAAIVAQRLEMKLDDLEVLEAKRRHASFSGELRQHATALDECLPAMLDLRDESRECHDQHPRRAHPDDDPEHLCTQRGWNFEHRLERLADHRPEMARR